MTPGRVDPADAVAQGEPAARHHQAGVAGGDRQRDAGGHQCPPAAGLHDDAFAGEQVEAGVARVGVVR